MSLTYILCVSNTESIADYDDQISNHVLGKRKCMGVEPDLRYVYDGLEIGCGEAEKGDCGEPGANELPKTMRDMFVLLANKYPNEVLKLRTFGIIMTGNYVLISCM